MMQYISCIHWFAQFLKSACCVLQAYLGQPEGCFHFIVQVLLWPIGGLLRVAQTTLEGTGVDMLEVEINKNTRIGLIKWTGILIKRHRAGKYREKVWRSLAVLCANIFQTCLCTRKPPLTLPPPLTHLSGSINVLFPPPVGSCSSLYHPTPSSLPVFRRVAALISLLKQRIYCEEQCDSLSSEQVCELS